MEFVSVLDMWPMVVIVQPHFNFSFMFKESLPESWFYFAPIKKNCHTTPLGCYAWELLLVIEFERVIACFTSGLSHWHEVKNMHTMSCKAQLHIKPVYVLNTSCTNGKCKPFVYCSNYFNKSICAERSHLNIKKTWKEVNVMAFASVRGNWL